LAWNYGGRDEICQAISRMIAEGVQPDQVTPDLMSKYLYTAGIPDPDLVIRTSGEMRSSNFLIWQTAYSEWYATPTLWPDFDREEYYKALVAFSQRERRFGKTSSQVTRNQNAR
jgi:undecaprenyl diphosphate synthase